MDDLDRDGYPVLPEPADHLDDLDGINRPTLEQQRIDKREELLAPDATTPALAGLSVQMTAAEQKLSALVDRFDTLIKVLKERR